MKPTLRCWRCGAVAKVDWKDIRTFGDPDPVYIAGQVTCPRPGCDDSNASDTQGPNWWGVLRMWGMT